MARKLDSLAIGTVIKDVNTLYNDKPILWKVMEHDHLGDPSGSTALVTNNIITLKCFDAKEPNSSNSDIRSNGNNRYSVSNIKQWLNSDEEAGAWYSAQHSTDTPPTNENIRNNYNEYDKESGFLYNFSLNMKNALIETSRKTAKNTVIDGGGYENVTSKIFLLSATEIGFENENGVAEGSIYSLFNTTSERIAHPTAEAVSKSEYIESAINPNREWFWWLRTPYSSGSCSVRNGYSDSDLDTSSAASGIYGVRPACVVSSSILVSDLPDTDGCYIIKPTGVLIKNSGYIYITNENNYDIQNDVYTSIESIPSIFSGMDVDDLLDTPDYLNGDRVIDKFNGNLQIINPNYESGDILKLKGIKSTRELIVASGDINNGVAQTINSIIINNTKSDNSSIKLALSIDNGDTWKTHDGANWQTLDINIPKTTYNTLSSLELSQWNNAKDVIYSNGIDVSIFNTLDFNTLTENQVAPNTIRFAYVLDRPNYSDNVSTTKITWNFNAKGSMKLMAPTVEYELDMFEHQIKFTSLIENSMIITNVII